MGVLVGGAFRQLRAIIPGCGSFFSPLPPREKKNDRIALERRYFDEEIFLLFEDWALAKAIYKSTSVGSLHRYFSSLLVLTDKMAFTCRHVLILDRDRRLPATIAPDFSVAMPRFFIIHVKMYVPMLRPRSHFAFYIFGFLRVSCILHSIVERALIKAALILPLFRSLRTISPVLKTDNWNY